MPEEKKHPRCQTSSSSYKTGNKTTSSGRYQAPSQSKTVNTAHSIVSFLSLDFLIFSCWGNINKNGSKMGNIHKQLEFFLYNSISNFFLIICYIGRSTLGSICLSSQGQQRQQSISLKHATSWCSTSLSTSL